MRYSKLKISSEATSKLRSLRQRTGITPNLLCRLAVMLSLEEGAIGDTPPPNDDGMEFNAYTLTGDYTSLIGTMVRFVEEPGTTSQMSDNLLLARFRAHIHRGIGTLSVRVRTTADVARLIADAA